MVRNVWDIFAFNGAQIKADFERIVSIAPSQQTLLIPYTMLL
jgi:hypothetical protein